MRSIPLMLALFAAVAQAEPKQVVALPPEPEEVVPAAEIAKAAEEIRMGAETLRADVKNFRAECLHPDAVGPLATKRCNARRLRMDGDWLRLSAYAFALNDVIGTVAIKSEHVAANAILDRAGVEYGEVKAIWSRDRGLSRERGRLPSMRP